MKKNRQSNIEVLRVLCMFLIVISHYIYHGLKQNSYACLAGIYPFDIGVNISFMDYSFMELLYLISRVAVDCYVMITGYFLITRLSFRWNGLISVWFQTLFYSVLIALLFKIFGPMSSMKKLLLSLLPIYSNAYWFVTTYVGLLLLAPFISKVALNLSKRNYLALLMIFFLMNFQLLYGSIFSNRIFQFIGFYLVGGYFKIYGIPKIWKNNSKLVYLIVLLLLWTLATLYNWIFNNQNWDLKSSEYNDLILFLALATFVLFLCMSCKSKYWRIITRLAPYTFGVYLIHDNELIRGILWRHATVNNYGLPMFIHCLLISFCIFILCVLIDYLKCKIFKMLGVQEKINLIISRIPKIEI